MTSEGKEEGLLEDPQGMSGPGFDRDSTASGDQETYAQTGDRNTTMRGGESATTTDTGQSPTADIGSIEHGWDVYASDGDKVGSVEEVGQGYLLLKKGFLFSKDIYAPASAITGTEHDRVYLNVTKDQIDTMGWDQPPTGETSYDPVTDRLGTVTADDDRTVATQSTTTDSDYVETQSTEPAQTRSTDTDEGDTTRVQRYEEELQAEKTEREAGAVRVSRDVDEEEQTLDVPVTREVVHVQSRTVDRPASDTSGAFQEETIEVPVREEGVEVRKEPRVAEELEIATRQLQDTERASDTVRKERVNVEEVGDVHAEGGSTSTDTPHG